LNISQISITCKFNKLLEVDKSDLFAISDAYRTDNIGFDFRKSKRKN